MELVTVPRPMPLLLFPAGKGPFWNTKKGMRKLIQLKLTEESKEDDL